MPCYDTLIYIITPHYNDKVNCFKFLEAHFLHLLRRLSNQEANQRFDSFPKYKNVNNFSIIDRRLGVGVFHLRLDPVVLPEDAS